MNKQDNICIVNDCVSDYVIVHGANANPSEINAAYELQSYIMKISGVLLPVISDNTNSTRKEIVVGKTNREAHGDYDRNELGDDGFIIKTTEDKLWLVGGETRGTLYAVYTFLEEYLECRFYTASVEKIPKSSNITVPFIEENKQIPVFKYRDMTYSSARIGYFSSKLKANGSYTPLNKENGSHYKFAPGFVHTFAALTDTDSAKQPCLTDPDILNIAIEKVRQLLNSDPDINIIEISQNDNRNYCTCENCNRVFEEEGSQSGAIIRFVNAIAEKFAEEYPKVIFQTLAYSYSQTPPKVTKTASNVAVRLCPIYCCYNHPMDLETYAPERYKSVKELLKGNIDITEDHRTDGLMDAHNIFFMQDFKRWSEICKNLVIWQYSTNCHHTQLHYPNFKSMLLNYRLYANSNVRGVFDMGNGSETSDFPELRAYIAAKCMWNPNMSMEEYNNFIDDFLEGVYGPGWSEMRNYLDHTSDLLNDVCCKCLSFDTEDNLRWTNFDCGYLFPAPEIEQIHSFDSYPDDLTSDMIRNYEKVDWSKYWNWYGKIPEDGSDYLIYAEKCFSKAMAISENEQQRSIIEKTYIQVMFYRSWYNTQQYNAGKGKYSAVKNMLDAYYKAYPNEFTEQEQNTYKEKIFVLAENQSFGPNIKYNKQLYKLLKKYNINEMREGKIINFSVDPETYIDFRIAPNEWF